MLDWPATEADNVNWWRAARDGNEKSLTKGIFWDDVKFISRWYSGWHRTPGSSVRGHIPGYSYNYTKTKQFWLEKSVLNFCQLQYAVFPILKYSSLNLHFLSFHIYIIHDWVLYPHQHLRCSVLSMELWSQAEGSRSNMKEGLSLMKWNKRERTIRTRRYTTVSQRASHSQPTNTKHIILYRKEFYFFKLKNTIIPPLLGRIMWILFLTSKNFHLLFINNDKLENAIFHIILHLYIFIFSYFFAIFLSLCIVAVFRLAGSLYFNSIQYENIPLIFVRFYFSVFHLNLTDFHFDRLNIMRRMNDVERSVGKLITLFLAHKPLLICFSINTSWECSYWVCVCVACTRRKARRRQGDLSRGSGYKLLLIDWLNEMKTDWN